MKRLLLGGIIGGIVMYAWSFLAWTVLPLHMSSLKTFRNEAAVAQAISANAGEAGVYYLPDMRPHDGESGEAAMARTVSMPHMLASVRLNGDMNMGALYGLQFLFLVITSLLITWLLTKTSGLSLMGKAIFAMVVGLVVSVLGELPNWNWWGFSASFTLGNIIDHIVGCFLAGLAIARFAVRN